MPAPELPAATARPAAPGPLPGFPALEKEEKRRE